MAADNLRYAAADSELFDPRRLPPTQPDARSVGELLSHVDHQARQLLMDVGAADAGALLHGWPPLADAAGRAWDTLPAFGHASVATQHVPEIDRIRTTARAIERRLGRARWPGQQQPDVRLGEMASTLDRVAELVARFGTEIPRRGDAVGDLQAARALLMHGLYLTAHAVGVALYDVGRHQYVRSRRTGRYDPDHAGSPYAIAPVTEWIHRMAVCETLADRYLRKPHAAGIAVRALAASDNDHRLAHALARWHIQTHRTLASQCWEPNLVLIARTQAMIAAATSVLLQAAHPAGHDETDRLESLVAGSAPAWNELGRRWGDLTRPDARVDAALLDAAAEVRAAYREITHHPTGLADLETIAARPGFTTGLKESLQALEPSLEIAHLALEKAWTPGLRGPARALSIRAHNDIEAGLTTGVEDSDIVWVSPADILAKRTIPLPEPVARALINSAQRTVDTAAAAAQAATAASAPHQDHPLADTVHSAHRPEPPQSHSRLILVR
ncbi:MAG: hypothetical protein U0R78_14210 [Nocardioidaceae bacterium]